MSSLLALVATPILLIPQVDPTGPGPDSARVLDAARSAQAEFERIRRDYAPSVLGGGGGRCDEVVGRFCFWHGGDDDWDPPPEHARIVAGRGRLIRRLDSLGGLSPGDEWIVGQLVRYLVEAGRLEEATATAGSCRATPWWCGALQGYVHHAAQRFARADSAFASALALAPQALRCDWNDLSVILEHVPRAYRRASCADRADLEARLWWLADPLYLIPGNERRTEHYARRVLGRLQDRARSGHDVRWGSDLDQLLVRYGWPVGWERDASRGHAGAGTSVISHHAPRARAFLPPRGVAEEPGTLVPEDWDLDPARPRSNYAPAYARWFDPLKDAQVAWFRRQDSAVIVAAFDPRNADANAVEGQRPGKSAEAALVFAPAPPAPATVGRDAGIGPFRLSVTVPWAPGVVSLEALTQGDSARAVRTRWWLPMAADMGLAMSPPLLFDPGDQDSVPGTLEELFPRIRPSSVVQPGDRLGVYWETRNWGTQATAHVTVTVARAGASWLSRAARTLGLGGADPPAVSLGWTENLNDSGGVMARSLVLGLPEGPGGAYLLRIEMRVGADTATAERRLTVAGR
ncbi:MAG TPA: hypothetical protein VD793_04225 [Gemmatimonadales bacterium]|nr:hypothetical protein [Gemmatimonadales bacterium]